MLVQGYLSRSDDRSFNLLGSSRDERKREEAQRDYRAALSWIFLSAGLIIQRSTKGDGNFQEIDLGP